MAVILNISISIMASVIVLIYTEWREREKGVHEELIREINRFFEKIRAAEMKFDSNLYSTAELASLYFELLAIQENLSEDYYAVPTMVEPTLAFGDAEKEIVYDLIEKLNKKNVDKMNVEDAEEVHEGMRGSIEVMHRQVRLCKMRLVKEAETIEAK